MKHWIGKIGRKVLNRYSLCPNHLIIIKETHQIWLAIARIARNCPRMILEWDRVQKWVYNGAKPFFFTLKWCYWGMYWHGRWCKLRCEQRRWRNHGRGRGAHQKFIIQRHSFHKNSVENWCFRRYTIQISWRPRGK